MCLPAHDPRIQQAKENMNAKPADANNAMTAVTQPEPAAPAPSPPPPPAPTARQQTPTTVQQPRVKRATGSRTTRKTTTKQNLSTGLSIGGPSEGGLNV